MPAWIPTLAIVMKHYPSTIITKTLAISLTLKDITWIKSTPSIIPGSTGIYLAIRPILHLPPVENLLIRRYNSSAFNQIPCPKMELGCWLRKYTS